MNITEPYNRIMEKLTTWAVDAIGMLPNLVLAILILVLFYLIGSFIRSMTGKLLRKTTDNHTIINLIETIVGVIVVGIGFFIALSAMNLYGTVRSLLAAAGIIGLALGFAFQDIAANFISGILLSIRQPFIIGDIIQTKGYYGTVRKLNLRNTIIDIPDGKVVYIPNKMVFENPLENYTEIPSRRIDLECGISFGDDLDKVKEVAIKAVESLDNYDKDQEVEFYFEEFGESSINFVIRFWIDFRENKDFWSVRSDAMIALKNAFDENDIRIPYPIRTHDFGVKGGEKLDQMLSNGK